VPGRAGPGHNRRDGFFPVADGRPAAANAHAGTALLGVSRNLGYGDDGVAWYRVRDRPVLSRRLRLTRADWQAARTVPVQIHGLEPCLPHFGV
jgi:hypothetical protein